LVRIDAGQVGAIDQDAARCRLVQLGEQLHERGLPRPVFSDNRDDPARRQLHAHIVQHETLGAGVCERDVLEADALGESRGRGQVGMRLQRGGIVFEPCQAPRAVHPHAAQKSDLPHRPADVRRQSRSGSQRQQHVARRRIES